MPSALFLWLGRVTVMDASSFPVSKLKVYTLAFNDDENGRIPVE